MAGEKIIFALIVSLVASQTCYPYKCTTMTTTGDCIEFATNVYKVLPCQDGYYCPTTLVNSASQCKVNPTPTTTLKYPGVKCTTATECQSNVCTNNACGGVTAGSECKSVTGYMPDVSCNPGYYCDYGTSTTNGTCTALLTAGATCTSSHQCTYGYGCYNSKCTLYYSIASKTAMGAYADCASNASPFCSSGFCISFAANNTAYCADAVKSAKSTPTSCEPATAAADCMSNKVSGFTTALQGSCNCAYADKTKSYCSTYSGDKYASKLHSLLKDWDTSSNPSKCNIDVAYGDQCWAAYWGNDDYSAYGYYSLMTTYYPTSPDILSCTKTVYFPTYATVKKYYDDHHGYGVLVGLSVVLLSILA